MAPTFDENIKLAYAQAHRLAGKLGLYSIDELENAALLGLSKAVERFDPSLKKAFSSFAVPYIYGEMLHYLRSISPVPRRLQELYCAGRKMQREGSSDDEIAAGLSVDIAQWHLLKKLARYFFRTTLDVRYYELMEEYGRLRQERILRAKVQALLKDAERRQRKPKKQPGKPPDKWLLISPSGEQIQIRNLHEFCRQHNSAEPDTQLHLVPQNLSQVARRTRHTHKGWRCKKLETHAMDMDKAV